MLEQSEISHYLLSLGLVKPRAIRDEELVVVEASRRNVVFIASTASGPAYVVKQAVARHAATLSHEAAVLGALATTQELRALVPAVAHHDPAAARLVLRTHSGAQDWNRHHRAGRSASFPARQLGQALAALHRRGTDGVAALPPGVDRMWGLTLPDPPLDFVLDLSEAAQDLLARLQASEWLCDRLTRLSDVVAGDTLVHGDLRWDNCLMVAAPGARRRTRLLLIDWELAGAGAPVVDVGTVLAEYLRVWLSSIPMVAATDLARLLAHARYPLASLRPSVHAFWTAYRSGNADAPPLAPAIELAAVRLLQTAIELARGLPEVSAHVMALVQVADNMLRDPEPAALDLLGLRA